MTTPPPAPTPDKPVTVELEDLTDDWLALHGLEIVPFDGDYSNKGITVRSRKSNEVNDG
jgi:hypothetical protein